MLSFQSILATGGGAGGDLDRDLDFGEGEGLGSAAVGATSTSGGMMGPVVGGEGGAEGIPDAAAAAPMYICHVSAGSAYGGG